MRYWLLSLPREDMEHCMKVGVFGLRRKHTIGNVRSGDKIACYITKEYKVIALGEATSDYYLDDEKVFRTEGHFIDRFKFKAPKLAPELNFMDVIDQLSFIKNIAYWSVYLRNGIVEMSAKDWDLLSKTADKSVKQK